MSESTQGSALGRPLKVTEQHQLATLFDLGRRVTSVLDLDELLHKIPELVARVIAYDAFAVYLLDERRQRLRIAYPVGYPEGLAPTIELAVGEGLVGTVVETRKPLLVNDVRQDPRYKSYVPDMRSTMVAPLLYKGKVIGALNVLSHLEAPYTDNDLSMLNQFGVHVAVALENARLFEQERRDAHLFETLAEIGRDVSSILELDELLKSIAHLAKRVIDYRTFGILLLDEAKGVLELRVAVQYGVSPHERPRFKLGEGLVGYAALHKEPVLVTDVSKDPRYIALVPDVRSELVVPLLDKGRCIGVFDLESPELDAFDRRHIATLTVLASQAAVAIENARLYEQVRANQDRLDRELRFAQRVQEALLPATLPRRLRGLDVAARFAPARELGGDFYDFLPADANTFVVTVGDVSGKGVPAALYSAFAGELIRSRTYRRRYTPDRATPAMVLAAVNMILHERALEEYYCTLCYAAFDFKKRVVSMANSGLPYPVRCTSDGCGIVALPGVPLGAFPNVTYDEVMFPLQAGDVYAFYSDGISEAVNQAGEEFGRDRIVRVVEAHRTEPAARLVEAVYAEVAAFQSAVPQHDDLTLVVVKITT